MAGLFDKAKQAAQQALDEAKKGIDSGQAKLDEVQVKRDSERLLSQLGAAFFAEQRHGGSRDAVNDALDALDAHVQQHGMIGFPAAAVTPGEPAPPPDTTPSPPPPDATRPATPPAAADGSGPSGDSPYDVPPSTP